MAGTCTVACKLPNGIILSVMPPIEIVEIDGKKAVAPTSRIASASVELKGFSMPVGVALEDPTPVAGGYALTHGVDADFMEAWLGQNSDSLLVKNNLIFVAAKGAYAASQAKEQKEVLSNLEPLRQGADPRQPKERGFKIEKAA